LNNDEVLTDIICKILLLEETQISDTLAREDIEEWDSMSHLVLVSECENTFNVSFSDDEVVEIQTIGDLKQTLTNHNINL
jgi:acyl carrier protein